MFKLFIADLKMLLRNKQALFWSLFFPLIFTFVFGSFFAKGDGGNGTLSIVNKSNTEIAKNFETSLKDTGIFKVQNDDSFDKAKELMDKDKVSVVVYIPERFGSLEPNSPKKIKIYYVPTNRQSESIVESFSDKYLTTVNMQIQKALPIFSVEKEEGNKPKFNYFDFILIGLIGMALMNSSIQGVAIAMSKYKEDKILKRMTTTPVKSWQFIGAEVFSRLVLNVVQVTLILVIGTYAYDAHINGSIFLVYVLSLIGAILFQSIGFVIASFAKTTDAAEGMSTAITVPMMFLAGVFFPIESLPKWLSSVVQYLPLAPLLRNLRGVALEKNSIFENPNNMGLVLVWIVIMLLIAAKRFRLSEE